MCGIAGIVADLIDERHDRALRFMMAALVHRGPDGEGRQSFGRCLLGHRRLAIVDLSTGHQPMCTSDGRLAVTFNGEIYGYQQIRRSLQDFPFRTKSDTEVILALYRTYGHRTAERLPGMFAFAIWDESRQELLCARDRFGEKPLYYATGRNGEFLFASEIKSILASGLVEPVLDRHAVSRYLQRQCVRANQSIYKNIGALPPAHCLRYSEGRVEVYRYWSAPQIENDIDSSEAAEQFTTLLREAVRRQLIADVPVGAFLSGGLDSSTVCQVASSLVQDLQTFSFDFEGDHSEVEYARAVAKHCNTQHTELATHGVEIADLLTRMQAVYDEPFADSSTIPSYLLSQEARRHVKVALTGDGGDEMFGGYLWYKPLLWMQSEGRIGLLRWVAERAANRLARAVGIPGAIAREHRIMGLAYGRQYKSVLEAHRSQLNLLSPADIASLGLQSNATSDAEHDRAGSMDDSILLDVNDYMPANNLTRVDRASMAHGLELRAPFLDVDFASFCISLPYRLKVSTREDKIILRQAFTQLWPAAIRKRHKQGFGAPVARWLQHPQVAQLERQLLHDRSSHLYDVVDYQAVQRLTLRDDSTLVRWTLLVLAIWLWQAQIRLN